MHVHNFEAIVTTFYHKVIYVTADCNSRDASIIHSPLTFKIRYGYELGAGHWVVAFSISSHEQTQ